MGTEIKCSVTQQLRHLLNAPLSRNGLLAMLKAYVDESGIHGGSGVCAVAGFVGKSDEWEIFTRRWEEVCARWGVPREDGFHMKAFENRETPYCDWSEAHGRMLLADLLRVLNAREIRGFGSAVLLSDSNSLSLADRSLLTADHPDKPYFLCLQHCLVEAAHFADGMPSTELVGFTFDRQDEYHGDLIRIYDAFRALAAWPLHSRLADPVATANRRETPPLQAADIAAYECYKGMLNKLGSTRREIRWSMKQLLKRRFALKHLTLDVLRKIAADKRAETQVRS